MPTFHRPVLLNEAIEILGPKSGGVYVDCTLGGGGHAAEILRRSGPDGILIGIDRDEEAIRYSSEVLAEFRERFKPARADFRNIATVLAELGIEKVDGLLYDLGVSSHQLDTAERGFSLTQDAPLDMRMDRSQPLTAADLVNRLPEGELAGLIRGNSDERWAGRIAKRIVEVRAAAPIRTTKGLADLVATLIPRRSWPPDTHPATRTFQALRIAVNSEIEALEESLKAGIEALRLGGRVALICYQSGEDRVVKQTFRLLSGQCQCPPRIPVCACGARKIIETLTKKPVVPMLAEIAVNSRARSARLRAAVRVSEG